nr:MAG TPA: hypothetical protein [Caudoviricetes sp.]
MKLLVFHIHKESRLYSGHTVKTNKRFCVGINNFVL